MTFLPFYGLPRRLAGLGFARFDKHFYRESARSKPYSVLPFCKKTFLRFAAHRQQADVLYANGGLGFCKYEAKNLWTITFALRSDRNELWPTEQIVFLKSQISTRLRRSRQQVSNLVSSIIHAFAKFVLFRFISWFSISLTYSIHIHVIFFCT